MICPHCSADLLRRERTGGRCARCHREFALDPQTNPLRLHDLRMRRLVVALRDPGPDGGDPLPFTRDQLRLAAARAMLTGEPAPSEWLKTLGCLPCLAVPLTIIFVAVGLIEKPRQVPATLGWIAGITAGLALLLALGHLATRSGRRHPGEPASPQAFDGLLTRWREVYGTLPAGLLTSGRGVLAAPPGPPRAAVFCTSPVVAFLRATRLTADRHVLVVCPADEQELRGALRRDPGMPVLVLHDADPAGHLAAVRLRAELPPGTRVVDAGLRARVAAGLSPPVLLRPDRVELAALAGTVTPDETAWLAAGRVYPLAMLRPAQVLRAVEQAVDRTVARTERLADPDEARLAATGFLRWPS